MSVTVYIPRDATALSLGARSRGARDRRGSRAARGFGADRAQRLARPVLARAAGRGADQRRAASATARCRRATCRRCSPPGFLDGGQHALRLGPVESIPYLQEPAAPDLRPRRRHRSAEPRRLPRARRLRGAPGARCRCSRPRSCRRSPIPGLRGRGGAAFPTGIKWKTVLDAPGAQKYVVCNADEGDSGTFADRMLMEGDPFCLIEGMTIAGLAVGATRGYIYLRCEYPHAHDALHAAIAAAYAARLSRRRRARLRQALRPRGAARRRRLHLRRGDLDARILEGKRGEVRFKPPLPAHQGTVRLPDDRQQRDHASPACRSSCSAARQYYRDYGMGRSRGTLPIQLAGNIKRGGLVERAFGVTLRELLYDYGGGTRSGRPIRAVQVGGPLGAYWPESQFDTPLDYEAFAAGRRHARPRRHRGVRRHRRHGAQARYAMEFCAIESCGKCTPVPHRLDARRRSHRPADRGRSCCNAARRCCATCATRCSMVRCARSAA